MSNPMKPGELETVAAAGQLGGSGLVDGGEQGRSLDQQEGSSLDSLVRRAQSGDVEAFGELVRAYQRRVLSVAYRLLGNSEDANDVSQDAFVRAYSSLSQLEDPSRFGPWLMRVVSNLALNFRRSRQLRSAASFDETDSAAAGARRAADGQRLADKWHANTGTISDELSAAVGRAIEKLPDKQRLALILFSVEGMPQKEVAKILNCSIELVKWNVFEARRKLKDMLAEFL